MKHGSSVLWLLVVPTFSLVWDNFDLNLSVWISLVFMLTVLLVSVCVTRKCGVAWDFCVFVIDLLLIPELCGRCWWFEAYFRCGIVPLVSVCVTVRWCCGSSWDCVFVNGTEYFVEFVWKKNRFKLGCVMRDGDEHLLVDGEAFVFLVERDMPGVFVELLYKEHVGGT